MLVNLDKDNFLFIYYEGEYGPPTEIPDALWESYSKALSTFSEELQRLMEFLGDD